jgi:hypothetical protein
LYTEACFYLNLSVVVLCGISPPFGRLSPARGNVTHVLLTRAPLYWGRSPFSCDLHVLGAPLTFVLSQDQTLQLNPSSSRVASWKRQSPGSGFGIRRSLRSRAAEMADADFAPPGPTRHRSAPTEVERGTLLRAYDSVFKERGSPFRDSELRGRYLSFAPHPRQALRRFLFCGGAEGRTPEGVRSLEPEIGCTCCENT